MKKLTTSILAALLAGSALAITAQPQNVPTPGRSPCFSYDADGDGAVSRQEFESARQAHRADRAAQGRPMRNAASAPSFADLDKDGNGLLTQEEVQAARYAGRMGPPMGRWGGMGRGPGMGGSRNMPLFSEFDLDGNGVILEQEFYEARGKRISERAAQGYGMRGLAAALPFSRIDQDGDGNVTPAEFSAAQASHRLSKSN